MTYKNDIGEILKLEDLCNIGNVSVEPYVRAREMRRSPQPVQVGV